MSGPQSTCAKSVVLGKAVPGVIVVANPAVDFDVTMGLTPLVTWDNLTPASAGGLFCVQPSDSDLSFDLTCTHLITGAVVGPFAATSPQLGIPTVPGLQPVPAGFAITIPASSLPDTGPWTYAVVGAYEVVFAGTPTTTSGGGNVTGVGDVEICLVEPSPADPTIPRLDFSNIDLEPVRTARRGDQVASWYLLSNNDPTEAVTIDLSATSSQAARSPTTPEPDP